MRWRLVACAAVAVALHGESSHRRSDSALEEKCPSGGVPWPRPRPRPHATSATTYDCQDVKGAVREAEEFIYNNMPPWDVLNNGTLSEGILGPTVNLSLTSRQKYNWAASVPHEIWQDFVLPYASVNEPRNDWRQLLSQLLAPLVINASANSLEQVATILNKDLWSTLRPQDPIVFRSDSTPLIYDPMSTITFGYASCTGISILFVDALRSLGVPARLVGTPAWHGKEADGNHNWVEVWLGEGHGLAGEGWAFIEGAPAGSGELFSNPCDKWFCNPQHFDGNTKAYAAQYNRHSNATIYPMAWDLRNLQIPGIDRSSYYNSLCQKCGAESRAVHI